MFNRCSLTSSQRHLQSRDSSSDTEDERQVEKNIGTSKAGQVSSCSKSTTTGGSTMAKDDAGHPLSLLPADDPRGGAGAKASVFHAPEPSRSVARSRNPASVMSNATATGGQGQNASRVTSFAGGASTGARSTKPGGSSLFRALARPFSRAEPRNTPPLADPGPFFRHHHASGSQVSGSPFPQGPSVDDRRTRFVKVYRGTPAIAETAENRKPPKSGGGRTPPAAPVSLLDQTGYEDQRRARRLEQQAARKAAEGGVAPTDR